MSSGPSSANHVAHRRTSPAVATPSDHMVTCTSHFVAEVCHRGVASAQIRFSTRSCLVTLNVPHALLNVNWLCTTSTSGHTAADRRGITLDDTSKAVATYGKNLSLPGCNSLLIHLKHALHTLDGHIVRSQYQKNKFRNLLSCPG